MSTDELIRMANQIAQFFASYPEDEACQGLHNHIQSFWSPNMRAQLQGHIEHGGAGLNALVVTAMQKPD